MLPPATLQDSFMHCSRAFYHYSITHSFTRWDIKLVMIHACIHSLIQPIDHSMCVFSYGHARIALSDSARQQLIALICYQLD